VFVICCACLPGKSLFVAALLRHCFTAAPRPFRAIAFEFQRKRAKYLINFFRAAGNLYLTVLKLPAPLSFHAIDTSGSLLFGSDAFYVCDQVEFGAHPEMLNCSSLVISALLHENHSEYAKIGRLIYLPVWSRAEMSALRQFVCPSAAEIAALPAADRDFFRGARVDADTLARRWEYHGGVPRYVMDDNETRNLAQLQHAAAGCDFQRVLNNISSLDRLDRDMADRSHRLLQYVINFDPNRMYVLVGRTLPVGLFQPYMLRISSPTAANLLAKQADPSRTAQLIEFIDRCKNRSGCGAVRGDIFEHGNSTAQHSTAQHACAAV
jgi:hypothetical protein